MPGLVQWVKGLALLWAWCRSQIWLRLLWLQHRLAALAPVQPLAWEPPYASGADLKSKKKKKLVIQKHNKHSFSLILSTGNHQHFKVSFYSISAPWTELYFRCGYHTVTKLRFLCPLILLHDLVLTSYGFMLDTKNKLLMPSEGFYHVKDGRDHNYANPQKQKSTVLSLLHLLWVQSCQGGLNT